MWMFYCVLALLGCCPTDFHDSWHAKHHACCNMPGLQQSGNLAVCMQCMVFSCEISCSSGLTRIFRTEKVSVRFIQLDLYVNSQQAGPQTSGTMVHPQSSCNGLFSSNGRPPPDPHDSRTPLTSIIRKSKDRATTESPSYMTISVYLCNNLNLQTQRISIKADKYILITLHRR